MTTSVMLLRLSHGWKKEKPGLYVGIICDFLNKTSGSMRRRHHAAARAEQVLCYQASDRHSGLFFFPSFFLFFYFLFLFPDPADMNYCLACCRERGCCQSLTLTFRMCESQSQKHEVCHKAATTRRDKNKKGKKKTKSTLHEIKSSLHLEG